jgi:serine/threonine protein kinase
MACSLADLILDRPGRIPESIIAYLLREILKGLAYLHRRQRIHRDLKSDNILLSMEGQVKIGDLGYCVQLSDQNPNRQTFAGTLLWMAPEVVNQDFYNEKVDIWSLGIITFELVTGEPPHYKDGQQKIVISILNHNAPSIDRNNFNISDELFSFVSRCLVKDPMGRADCEELLFHPFIQNLPCTCDEFRGFFEEWKLNR